MPVLIRRPLIWLTVALAACAGCTPTPSTPPEAATPASAPTEAVELTTLALPPTAPSADPGACTLEVNPHGTGCIDPGPDAISSPGQYGDNRHVLVGITFAGAPAAPGPASQFAGPQVLAVKTDGTTFDNGDAWKCLTCGVPEQNRRGANPAEFHFYPQGFRDGRRVLSGSNILDCGQFTVVDDRCTPDELRIYPIRWNVTADGTGQGGTLRELRIHPDDDHLGFNHVVQDTTPGNLAQYGYVGRLQFNPAPSAGLPATPRYDLMDVSVMFNDAPEFQPFRVDPDDPARLLRNPAAGMIGEFRGWSSDGTSALGIGTPESNNVDAYLTRNDTGASRQLTHHAHYTDPIRMSPDDQSSLGMLVVGSGRMDFMSAIPGIPPITDQYTTTGHISSIRNNGVRRFFLPYVINHDGSVQRQLNPGADPNWNGRADPIWSADGTSVVYWESLVTTPACGGTNPLPCPESAEPGGRHTRLIKATFPDRAPLSTPQVVPAQLSWGTPYHAGDRMPVRPHLPGGEYRLDGTHSGHAQVSITENVDRSAITAIRVSYTDFSDDGDHIINGAEAVEGNGTNLGAITFHADLRLAGALTGEKRTSADGFQLKSSVYENKFDATGTMTTVINDQTFTQPANFT